MFLPLSQAAVGSKKKKHNIMADKIYLYDSTLRDGAQTNGVDFSVADKVSISQMLSDFGIDYIEGGWPGANPTDDAFFATPPTLTSKLTAFGMTRRPSTSAENDPGLASLVNSGAQTITLVGKSWDYHVTNALGIALEDNIRMIAESIKHLATKKREAIFDAEHFFDGYKKNPDFALESIKAAYDNGARWIVLCDTNGGTLPHEISEIVTKVTAHIPGKNLGIHCHNDTENAVANSLAAVLAGVRQVQGTLNGLGERCGNANLVSIIPTLMLKMGYKTNIPQEKLKHLCKISHYLDERLNNQPNRFAAYVGSSAFAHKGGLHVSAVAKDPNSYEHITPETVGNSRKILISDQSGRSNIIARLKEIGFDTSEYSKESVDLLVTEVKEKESKGYAYDSADASFEILARRVLGEVPKYFSVDRFRVIDERRWNAKHELITLSEATVHVNVEGKTHMTVSEGNGPINALDHALRNALAEYYPSLNDVKLTDYKVRIIDSSGTDAITRVLIESEDMDGHRWITIGVSGNIIDASYNALRDSLTYKLMRNGK
jgi:2-isopropylmalate synthase